MTLQEERNKRFDEKFADYGGEYSDTLDVPRSLVKEFIESEVYMALAEFIGQEIERLEKEIEHIQKHSKGNYADGKVEAFTETMVHLTSLKELIK